MIPVGWFGLVAAAGFVASFGWAGVAVAAGDIAVSRPYTLSLGVEQFRWQEYDRNGRRLLTEQGPRGVVRLDWRAWSGPGAFVRGRIKAYAGIVDYDGQDGDGVFVPSRTDYRGASGELVAGLSKASGGGGQGRFGLSAAIGVEAWRRDIADSIGAKGQIVGGFTEDYRLYSGRVGIEYLRSGAYPSVVRLGLYRPFRVDEDFRLYGRSLRLHPGGRWSGYLAWRITSGRRSLELRYEGRRFAASEPVDIVNPSTSLTETVWQPRSHADLVELSLGYRF